MQLFFKPRLLKVYNSSNYTYYLPQHLDFRFKPWNKDLYYYTKVNHTIQINCTLLFEGNTTEINKVQEAKESFGHFSDSYFYDGAENCSWIRDEFNDIFYTSDHERNFPLAFSINVHESPQQIFRFLKAIYRSHNLYCIHYDMKADEKFKRLIMKMAVCLPNIIVPTKIEDVVWGWHTVLDAQMNCFEDLLNLHDQYLWKYVITLCGKEVPLRTNREMVDILLKLNDTSSVYLRRNTDSTRWTHEHFVNKFGKVSKTGEKLGPIPFNLEIQKSLAYYGLTVTFVKFLLHDNKSVTFRKFIDNVESSEEHFVSTLFKIPGKLYYYYVT